ncbi:MAG: LysE family translocator [Desulfobulbus sp.]|jgi:threonine/homoserine/homoserine lactone efflux protein
MFVLAQSAMYGRRAGLLIVFGLCTGLVLHTVAVVLGLAALLHASPSAFTVFKLVGAGYLLYLAWGAFRAVVESAAATRPPVLSDGRLYRRGIFMNSTNPKVSLFFLAFLPQFADPARGVVWLQLLGLGALFILATIFVFGLIALTAGSFGSWLNDPERTRTRRMLNRATGLLFVGLALSLLLSHR